MRVAFRLPKAMFPLAVLLVVQSWATAQSGSPKTNPIQWPVLKSPAVPQPPPNPNTIPVLKKNEWYVISSAKELVIRPAPLGLIEIKKRTGPIVIGGKFADGTEFDEEREYKGPFVYQLKAVQSGRVEVLAIPLGFLKEEEIESRTIDVMVPKPEPPVVVPPTPEPPVISPPASVFYFLIVKPDGPTSPETTRILSDEAWKTLTSKGHKYKDKQLSEVAGLNISIPSGTPLPCVVTLREEAGGSKIARGPIALPNTSEGILKLMEGVK